MRAGTLRHRVAIMDKVVEQNELGEEVVRWCVSGNGTGRRWASIRPLNGRELFEARQVAGEVTHEIRMRHVGLLSEQRLEHEGRVFEIASVINVDERNRETVCVCQERTS